MESWLLFALLSANLFGFNEFFKKIAAKENFSKNQYLLYSYLIYLLISFIYFIYTGSYFYMTLLFGVLIISRIILVIEKDITKIESLKYIDSSLFFPCIKLIRFGGGFFIGMFLFGEYLGASEIIFLIFGIISVLFLGYKKEPINIKDMKKGLFYLFLSSIFLLGTSTINKYIAVNHDPALYLFLSSILGIIYLQTKLQLSKTKYIFNKKELFYGCITGILGFLSILFLLFSLKEGKLVMVQLVSTISIVIPIFLSLVFLKEEVNIYKIFGCILFFVNLVIFYLSK